MLLDPTRIADKPEQPDSGYLLVTGATGFLGQYLLRDLTLAGFRIAVLVRPSRRLSAVERIESIMQKWESHTNKILVRPVVLEGSVTEDNVGLSSADIAWVSANVDSILHSAAIVKFDGNRASEPWLTNVEGTRNLLQVARNAEIENFHYVSTAYTCGIQNELVYEHLLDRNQEFRNDYERSKFEAEMLVKNSGIEKVTVFRPSVIVGDSQSGYTCSYHGLYVYLRLMALLIPNMERDENGIAHTNIHLPFTGYERRNLVPVDWVSNVITHLVSRKKAHGRTFHLTPDESTTARNLIDACCKYFHSTGVVYAGDVATESVDNSEFEANFLKNTGMYHAYDRSDPHFDRSNLTKFAGHLPCPMIDQATVHRFIKYGEQDNWGKRKQAPPVCNSWLHENLSTISASINRFLENSDIKDFGSHFGFGLNIIGNGGGQYTFFRKHGGIHVATLTEKGISPSVDVIVQLDSNELASQLHLHKGNWDAVVAYWFAEVVTSSPEKAVNRVA